MKDHEFCHDLVCNGDRRYPRGARAVGCSCASREIREQHELTELRAAAARVHALIAQWREQARYAHDFGESHPIAAEDLKDISAGQAFAFHECADDLEAALAAALAPNAEKE